MRDGDGSSRTRMIDAGILLSSAPISFGAAEAASQAVREGKREPRISIRWREGPADLLVWAQAADSCLQGGELCLLFREIRRVERGSDARNRISAVKGGIVGCVLAGAF